MQFSDWKHAKNWMVYWTRCQMIALLSWIHSESSVQTCTKSLRQYPLCNCLCFIDQVFQFHKFLQLRWHLQILSCTLLWGLWMNTLAAVVAWTQIIRKFRTSCLKSQTAELSACSTRNICREKLEMQQTTWFSASSLAIWMFWSTVHQSECLIYGSTLSKLIFTATGNYLAYSLLYVQKIMAQIEADVLTSLWHKLVALEKMMCCQQILQPKNLYWSYTHGQRMDWQLSTLSIFCNFRQCFPEPNVLLKGRWLSFGGGKFKEHISDAASNIFDEDIASLFCPTEDFAQQCAFTLDRFKLVMLMLGYYWSYVIWLTCVQNSPQIVANVRPIVIWMDTYGSNPWFQGTATCCYWILVKCLSALELFCHDCLGGSRFSTLISDEIKTNQMEFLLSDWALIELDEDTFQCQLDHSANVRGKNGLMSSQKNERFSRRRTRKWHTRNFWERKIPRIQKNFCRAARRASHTRAHMCDVDTCAQAFARSFLELQWKICQKKKKIKQLTDLAALFIQSYDIWMPEAFWFWYWW